MIVLTLAYGVTINTKKEQKTESVKMAFLRPKAGYVNDHTYEYKINAQIN